MVHTAFGKVSSSNHYLYKNSHKPLLNQVLFAMLFGRHFLPDTQELQVEDLGTYFSMWNLLAPPTISTQEVIDHL